MTDQNTDDQRELLDIRERLDATIARMREMLDDPQDDLHGEEQKLRDLLAEGVELRAAMDRRLSESRP